VTTSVRYLVDDVAVSADFYVAQLGFTVDEDWGGPFKVVARDDLRLWLSGPGSSAARAMPDGRAPAAGGWNRIVIEVDDIGAEVERLGTAGVTFRSEVVRGPGGAQVLIEDPAGNPIELFQPSDD
jgi:catechol 2,3-dioxygenase-like lactoylglutathione lyase family enzyme